MAEGETEILDADCAAVSFPEFYHLLEALAGEGCISG
jgi:5-enolpyruvylshikimate-3-phosphate synthase